jgi:hypothetical protein
MLTSSMSGKDVRSSPEKLNVLYYGTRLTEMILLYFRKHMIHTLQHIQIQSGIRSINIRI